MKMTSDLPDDFPISAKVAAPAFEVGPLGILRLKRRGTTVNSAIVKRLMDEADAKEMCSAVSLRNFKK